jgi:hypothetical protein
MDSGESRRAHVCKILLHKMMVRNNHGLNESRSGNRLSPGCECQRFLFSRLDHASRNPGQNNRHWGTEIKPRIARVIERVVAALNSAAFGRLQANTLVSLAISVCRD